MRPFQPFLAPALLLALGWSAGCDSGPDFALDTVSPTTVAIGAPLELGGVGFCGDSEPGAEGECAPAAVVSLAGLVRLTPAETEQYSDNRIRVVVPSETPTGAIAVVVSLDGLPSAALTLEVMP